MSLVENRVLCHDLEATVAGKKIAAAVVNQNPHSFVWFALEPGHAYCGPEESNRYALAYEDLLVGQILTDPRVRPGAYGVYSFFQAG